MNDPAAPMTPWRWAELVPNMLVLGLMAVLPLLEIVLRATISTGIPGSVLVVQHLTLVSAFMGAALAARNGGLLALSTGNFLPARTKGPILVFTNSTAALVSVSLGVASVGLVTAEREATEVIALGIQAWMVVLIMPSMLALIVARLVWTAGTSWLPRTVSLVVVAAFTAVSFVWPELVPAHPWWLAGVLLVATVLGMPMFAALGGLALVFFVSDGTPAASVSVESYSLATSPLFPAIPLFTLAGYVLSSGAASQRLVRLFSAWFGWLPGGTAVVTAVAFAFFTAITGASGVTILSLGGLLMPVLAGSKYPEKFSLGLLTTSGSIGALFPPSLPVILYAVSAQIPVDVLFMASLVPGIILVAAVAAYGVFTGLRVQAERPPFDGKEALASLRGAAFELTLPVIILLGIFGGFTTLVEAASITVVYAFIVEAVFHRDPLFWKQLFPSLEDCARLVGGVLLILGVALGLTNYLLDAQVPQKALTMLQAHVDQKWIFLLAVNVLLVVVGAAMDIYSAVLVVVPLISPMAAAYGVDPVHLGVIFLVNLQLGYIVPPVGENLFLASYRFNKPLWDVAKATFPFVMLISVITLVVTYVPALTLVPLHWMGK